MPDSDRTPGRPVDRHVPSRRQQVQPVGPGAPVAPRLAADRRVTPRWARLVRIIGLAGVLVGTPRVAIAAHWPEYNCLADAAHGGTASIDYPDELWAAAQELAGHTVTRAKPRVVIAPWLEGHGVFEAARLGGCYETAEWAIQITPQMYANTAGFEIGLVHELTHAVLDDLGMPGAQHHCWMADRNYHAQIARWLYAHNHHVNLMIIGAVVIGEDTYLDQCRALGLR